MKHKFLLTQFGIPTFCEMCGHVMWRGFVCQGTLGHLYFSSDFVYNQRFCLPETETN